MGSRRTTVSGRSDASPRLWLQYLTVLHRVSARASPRATCLGMESLGGRGSATPEMAGLLPGRLVRSQRPGDSLGLGRALLSAMSANRHQLGANAVLAVGNVDPCRSRPTTRAFYDAILPERHDGVFPLRMGSASGRRLTVSPERYMAFRPRRLMTPSSVAVAGAGLCDPRRGRWFARLARTRRRARRTIPRLLDALASDGYAYLSMAEGLDLPEGGAGTDAGRAATAWTTPKPVWWFFRKNLA